MTQSYGLPAVVPCQKNTVGSWNQPEAGRQEDVGLKAGAADASSGDGKQRNSPGAWPCLRADTGEKHPESSPKTRAQKHSPPTALICFPSQILLISVCLPPLALLHTNFKEITSHGCGGLMPAWRESDASPGWNSPYKYLLREWGWEKRSLFFNFWNYGITSTMFSMSISFLSNLHA